MLVKYRFCGGLKLFAMEVIVEIQSSKIILLANIHIQNLYPSTIRLSPFS